MAFLTSSRKSRIQSRIATKESALTKAYEAYDAALVEVKEYRFDSGEGSQRAENRDLKEFTKAISILEREIEHLYGQLNGTGIVKMNLRRRLC
jgi:hypothetical protein